MTGFTEILEEPLFERRRQRLTKPARTRPPLQSEAVQAPPRPVRIRTGDGIRLAPVGALALIPTGMPPRPAYAATSSAMGSCQPCGAA